MKETQILFSRAMVRAIQREENPKTQTRRPVTLPHNNPLGQWEPTTIGGENGGRTADGKTVPLQGGIWHTRTGECLMSPYGQPGDRLWVRETFFAYGRWEMRFSAEKGRDERHFIDMTLECDRAYQYAADEPDVPLADNRGGVLPGWWRRPSIFMPRAASRITLEVAGVRVERLQGISEADAIAEGVEAPIAGKFWKDYLRSTERCDEMLCLSARESYRTLWDELNAARGYGWDVNPWVWCIEFKVIKL